MWIRRENSPACFFKAPTLIYFSVFQLIFSPSLLFMSFSNSVFALFASIQGMCNIKRTFAMGRWGGCGPAMLRRNVPKVLVPSTFCTCAASHVAEEKPESVGSALQLWPNQLHLKNPPPQQQTNVMHFLVLPLFFLPVILFIRVSNDSAKATKGRSIYWLVMYLHEDVVE